jgi:IS5 family transposase
MKQLSFFSEENRLQQLSKVGDPLEKLQQWIDFEEFREPLEEALPSKSGSSKGGRPSMDCVMMFKAILLGKMYNVSDDQLEFVIADRLTFQRFLGLTLDDKVPDAKTIWAYRERLGENGTLEKLFAQLNEKIAEAGWVTREGSLVDATFVEVPKQRNTREENAAIKNGEVPAEWKETPNKLRQKDGDARWTKKNRATYYGYKNHVVVDQKSTFITTYTVTDASVHDSQPLVEMLSEKDRVLYADSAYVGEELHEKVQEKCKGIDIQVHEKGYRNKPLTAEAKETNREKSRVRARVEHVFGQMKMSLAGTFCRTIGIVRAKAHVAFKNIAYNMLRYAYLMRTKTKLGVQT